MAAGLRGWSAKALEGTDLAGLEGSVADVSTMLYRGWPSFSDGMAERASVLGDGRRRRWPTGGEPCAPFWPGGHRASGGARLARGTLAGAPGYAAGKGGAAPAVGG